MLILMLSFRKLMSFHLRSFLGSVVVGKDEDLTGMISSINKIIEILKVFRNRKPTGRVKASMITPRRSVHVPAAQKRSYAMNQAPNKYSRMFLGVCQVRNEANFLEDLLNLLFVSLLVFRLMSRLNPNCNA